MNRVRNHIFAVFLIALGLSACRTPTDGQETNTTVVAISSSAIVAVTAEPTPTEESTSPPTTNMPLEQPEGIRITDSLGREQLFTTKPTRIVSLAPSITEMLFAVGAGDLVVGNTIYCTYPPEAESLPKIGGYSSKTINLEAIVDLRPDLVIAGTLNQQSVVEALEKLDIPVVALAPSTITDVYTSIEQIGVITHHHQEASTTVKEMQMRIEAVSNTIASVPLEQRPTVFWEVFNEPLTTSNGETFIGQLIEHAGAINIFADQGEQYPQVSTESIVALDPQVILGPLTQADTLSPVIVAQRPGWATITAVRDGRIYLLDSDLVSRAGPRLADALEQIAKLLYPELFP